jgi:hypothetical protein
MWVTKNHTPFAVAGAFACDVAGRKQWLVAIRATFEIEAGGQLVRAAEQLPVARAPKFRSEPATSSLVHDADLVFGKRATDIILNAQAWAPGGRPTHVLDVGFELGRIRKSLRVYGERVWTRVAGGLMPSRPSPFVSIPIHYERAFGGADPRGQGHFAVNPVGRGYAFEPAALVDKLVPNIEDPREPLDRPEARPRKAAGFGAIAGHWPQRARYAGTYDERWQRERAPLWPEDYDTRFAQAAPEDQQVEGFLRGGELCTLHNLSRAGTLRFALPTPQLRVITQFADGEIDRDAVLHTVFIEPDENRLTLVWCSAIECHDREHLLERSLILAEGKRTWAERRRSTSTT